MTTQRPPLEDLSPMPFGKFAGRSMQDVPAAYLHFLWSKPGGLKGDGNSMVGDYIRRNLDALKKEYKDGIW